MTSFDVLRAPGPAVVSHTPDVSSSAAPKKRRRRTAATGASEDCFTCRGRQTKCDRRRPYCGQCLEIGKDCSGYRTTLTWGVGVASRGKLRGLSLPVAKKETDDLGQAKPVSVRQRRKSSTSKVSKAARDAVLQSVSTNDASTSSYPRTLPVHAAASNTIKLEVPESRSYQSLLLSQIDEHAQGDWQYGQYPTFTSPVETQAPVSLDQSMGSYPLSSSGSLATFNDAGYVPSTDYAQTSGVNGSEAFPPFPFFTNPFSEQQLMGSTNDQNIFSSQQTADIEQNVTNSFTYPQASYMSTNGSQQGYVAFTGFSTEVDGCDPKYLPDGAQSSFMIPQSLASPMFSHLKPRMRYLLDYYEKFICSVLVTFDGPVNPYRMHILQLATRNEGLQNALAALAINNMRMRERNKTKALGYVEEWSDDSVDTSKPTREEIGYKTASITQLQLQLANPRIAQDDSVLATLLILCLFHVCDSGFSKFKTQLEGVQKLLSMRDPSVRSGFIGWVEMFFTWFDVMTSTVNDRETAIRGDRLDMTSFSSNLGALEQFSGCDGRLFKLIARLGRLNMLSQKRTVRPDEDVQQTPRPVPPPHFRRGFNEPQQRRSFDPSQYMKLDGNGWGGPIDEEEAFVPTDSAEESTSNRPEFWSEWRDIRARLLSWSMDLSSIPSPDSPDGSGSSTELLGPEQMDLLHINESFRSSALLYTERLANPTLPSSNPKFQNYVRNALHHIGALPITSCVNKFLLWPLFIAGTECVEFDDRVFVRERCLEIQLESGFYNNLSVLKVLERVWKEQDHDMRGGESEEVQRRRRDSCNQAFRWRQAMDRADGEYIIV